MGKLRSDAMDVLQRDRNAFLSWDVHASNAGHVSFSWYLSPNTNAQRPPLSRSAVQVWFVVTKAGLSAAVIPANLHELSGSENPSLLYAARSVVNAGSTRE